MNRLTDEQLTEIVREFPIAEPDGGMDAFLAMALMSRELQQWREAAGRVFMYGISAPDGTPYMDEFCVCSSAGELECVVDELNEMQCEGGGDYRVVPLYVAPPTITLNPPTAVSWEEQGYRDEVIEAIQAACRQAGIQCVIEGDNNDC
ncbi:hypothetical protein SOASR030_01690 [Leminorella grimontii]|uniref:Uncharacterized protein n=1 Tax=Leminorella grimontii TaxID=82981 RepID=A0AAV5N074_9GAMM|nr:hypothetical protein [Leminorella grimontii]KFC95375.1 hypothetical protein GLGR_1916 [Leminorella grimontii ATCC 33999 = DSM 5078]GKX54057.1 hypothetical protein SOASR030_01690 [Leminorella grimontii]VFS60180.1 Uncharacterised protein [Leminorella grimontii]